MQNFYDIYVFFLFIIFLKLMLMFVYFIDNFFFLNNCFRCYIG